MKGIITALVVGFGLAALYGVGASNGSSSPSEAAPAAAKVPDGKPVFIK